MATIDKKSVVVSGSGANDEIMHERGSSLYKRFYVSDPAVISNLQVFIDNAFIRQESAAPYEWVHAGPPDPNELKDFAVGSYALNTVVSDDDGTS
ncbi:MAG: hypothetical protein WBG71_08640 [Leeuwenhoekiella sp.]